jgi:hypothetical protein
MAQMSPLSRRRLLRGLTATVLPRCSSHNSRFPSRLAFSESRYPRLAKSDDGVQARQRKCAAHHFVLGTSQEGPAMASTNKYLAQMNKSPHGVGATKECSVRT